MNNYLDTSVLISLYSLDANSAAAAQVMQAAAGPILITTFTELEIVNAFGLRVFRQEVTSSQAQASLRDLEKDVRAGLFQMKPLPEHVFGRARQLSLQTTPRLGTRTSDLLHVAAALELASDWFYTFDRQQRKLAETVQLKVNAVPS